MLAFSCSMGRQLTFFFCREVVVLVNCASGSIFMPYASAHPPPPVWLPKLPGILVPGQKVAS